MTYGYEMRNGTVMINHSEAAVIKQIYKNYISGMSFSMSAKKAGLNIPHGSVKRLLLKKCYLGDDFYPAIIDKETYLAAYDIDGDICFCEYAKPTPEKKTVDEIADEVIAGKWDNGAERERLLTAAGYDYNAVQKRVNEKLYKKTVDEIANEVIRGDWGNGAERRERLTAAGYDYSEVQRKVNQLIK